MKLGVITKDEKYWGLAKLKKSIIEKLSSEHDTIFLEWPDRQNKGKLQAFFEKAEVVISLSSKCIDFDRPLEKPILHLGHAWMDHGAGINLFVNQRFFRSYDLIAFASEAAKRKYEYIYPRGISAFILPYFTDINEVAADPIGSVLSRHSIPSDKKIILYFGRICREKNILGAIDFYNQVKNEDNCLILVGSCSGLKTFGFNYADDESAYCNEVKKMADGSKGSILMLDNMALPELASLINHSTLTLNLSLCFEEDFGISNIESLALGTPIVATAWGGFRDTITDQVGRLVPVVSLGKENSAIEINKGIELTNLILADSNFRAKVGALCRARAEKYYSGAKYMQQLRDILAQLFEGWSIRGAAVSAACFEPREWIGEAYRDALEHNNVNIIYENNPRLFSDLYKFYQGEK